jgi:hypothetical protein
MPLAPTSVAIAALIAQVVGGDLVLAPEGTLDITPVCGHSRCTGKLRVSVTPNAWTQGAHVDGLATGEYRVVVRLDAGEPGERQGIATVVISDTRPHRRIAVAMRSVGTGKSIRGTVLDDNGKPAEGESVSALCTGRGATVFRRATTYARGAFTIADVGKPPCIVVLGDGGGASPFYIPSARVDKVPATGVTLVIPADYPPPPYEPHGCVAY